MSYFINMKIDELNKIFKNVFNFDELYIDKSNDGLNKFDKLTKLLQNISNYEVSILNTILDKHNIDNDYYYTIGLVELRWSGHVPRYPSFVFNNKKKMINNIILVIKHYYQKVFTPLILLQENYEKYIIKLMDSRTIKYRKCNNKKRLRKLTYGQIIHRINNDDAFSRNIYALGDFIHCTILKYIGMDDPKINLEEDYIDFIHTKCKVLSVYDIANFMTKLIKFHNYNTYDFIAYRYNIKDINEKKTQINPNVITLTSIFYWT